MSLPVFLADGVYTATLTPLKEDYSVDFELLTEHCLWLLNNGSQGIALLGTTGEANSFSLQERKEILEALIERGIPANKLMVGTGCCSLPETVELSKHATQLGAGGVLVLPPFYYKADQVGIEKYFEHFIAQVNDGRLRIYLYHFPRMSGIPFSIPLIQRLVKKYPGIVVGIKDSSGDLENMKNMIEQIPDFKVFAGTEKYLLDILEAGGAGCISATANVTVPLAAKVFQNWKAGQPAKAAQDYLVQVRTSFEGLPFSGALKTYLAGLKNDPRWLTVRPPNDVITTGQLAELKAKLKVLEFETA